MSEEKSYLAQNIRYLRKKRELSQDDLADMFGYKTYTTIQKWETGKTEPTIKRLFRDLLPACCQRESFPAV